MQAEEKNWEQRVVPDSDVPGCGNIIAWPKMRREREQFPSTNLFSVVLQKIYNKNSWNN